MLMCIQNLVRFCPFVLKILSGNEILTSIKGHNSVIFLQKMTGNNPKLDIVNVDVHIKLSMLMCMQNLVRFCQGILKIMNGNKMSEGRKDRRTE